MKQIAVIYKNKIAVEKNDDGSNLREQKNSPPNIEINF